MPDTTWKRITRVGKPDLMDTGRPGEIKIIVYTAPAITDHNWRGYFCLKVRELGILAAHGLPQGDLDAITANAKDDDLDIVRVIEAIDTAIECANDNYEANVLPNILAASQNLKAQNTAEVVERQAQLNERATKFAKPE